MPILLVNCYGSLWAPVETPTLPSIGWAHHGAQEVSARQRATSHGLVSC